MMKTAQQKESWKLNPETLTPKHDGHIQYWLASGTMLTAQMSLARARELVANGHAFCISDAAIGQVD